jgi:hypothetical protein
VDAWKIKVADGSAFLLDQLAARSETSSFMHSSDGAPLAFGGAPLTGGNGEALFGPA